MKISAKWMVALLAGSMAFGVMGCKGEPPEPPKDPGVVEVTANGAEISVVSFEIATPDFINATGEASRPVAEQAEVAVLRLKIKNTSDKVLTYGSKHFHDSKRLQLCTDPNPDNGERTDFAAIKFDEATSIHTPNQLIKRVEIKPGDSVTDEYLFEVPVVSDDQKLVLLVPGDIVGAGEKVFRFYVEKPSKAKPTQTYRVNEIASIDGVDVKVTRVVKEYAELAPKTEPKLPLKYAYAYTDKPVMAVYLEITNTSNEARFYMPSHNAAKAGISMRAANLAVKRIQINGEMLGKGQSRNITLNPGDSIKDVYYYEAPANDTPLEFELSGHILGVRGVYRFDLDYKEITLTPPDLEPYKNPDANKPAEGDAAAAEGDAAAAEGDAAAAE